MDAPLFPGRTTAAFQCPAGRYVSGGTPAALAKRGGSLFGARSTPPGRHSRFDLLLANRRPKRDRLQRTGASGRALYRKSELVAGSQDPLPNHSSGSLGKGRVLNGTNSHLSRGTAAG